MSDWAELTRQECFRLLAGERLGRVAVVDDRGPVVFPVNFVLDRYTVVFRTEQGTKLDAAARGSRVCFEVDGTDDAGQAGWSVLVRGEAIEVTDRAELARLRGLPLLAWAPGPRNRYVRILPAVLTGRRITGTEGRPWEPRSPGSGSANATTQGSRKGSGGPWPASGSCSPSQASAQARPP